MSYAARVGLRRIVFGLGSCLSEKAISRIDNAVNFLATGFWAGSRRCGPVPVFPDRERLFERMARDICNERVLYLEFGVYRGESMRAFSALLTHPESSLHGFDSFEGLPEDWDTRCTRGQFSTNGVIPKIDDSRVQFFKGWFSDTLPSYAFPEYDRLIINLDADLYSSTKFVLDTLRSRIDVGTYLYFDEFHVRNHELKAFREFEAVSGMTFEIVGQAGCWEHVALCRTA